MYTGIGTSVVLPPVNSSSHFAVPLNLTHWMIYLKPRGWILDYSSTPIIWDGNVSRKPTDNLKKCLSISVNKASKTFYFFAKVNTEPFPPSSIKALYPLPGHTITLYPPLMVANFLPYDFTFNIPSSSQLVPNGKVVSFYTVSVQPYSITIINDDIMIG